MPLVQPAEIVEALRGVIDPELGSDIVELGMVDADRVTTDADGTAVVTVALTTAGCPLKAQLQRDVRNRVGSLPGITSVQLKWTELDAAGKKRAMERARFNIAQRAQGDEQTSISPTTRVVAIASGKGGVGKSSVTVNLAAALATRGLKVGVLDADIWGFSVPRMLGVEGPIAARNGRMVPLVRTIGDDGGEVRIVSMGFLSGEQDALMWRGLILNRAVQHFLQDVDWGDDLDYLLLDMPPGTGDVQMGVAKLVPRTEVLVVTTPALAAQRVAARAVSMARKNYLRVAGVIENMSAFVCEHGESYPLFGSGGGAALATEAGAPLLGQVPLEPAVAAGGDVGEPAVLTGDGPAAQVFRDIAERIVTEAIPPVEMSACSVRQLSDGPVAVTLGRRPVHHAVPADDDAVAQPLDLLDADA